ncbi:hypothetical protein L9W76_00240 [Vibrio aestuarianus]|uniref:hypothetical protein n=3 Tax=Vibrio TaxID=662 RepID=UPI00237C6909|nr:hypothetical protein [Vibrio aestuarianus]MBF4424274.1 hypothetical protein [Vibrio anguillarum]MDE1251616.1 hypothetical protein [Vibrio aestuarianus]
MPSFVVSDFYMNVEQIQDKKAYYISDQLYGVYRVGIGQSTSSKDFMTKLVTETLEYFLHKYPEEKTHINSLYLFLFLADLKNRREFTSHMRGWLKSFSVKSILLVIKNWKIRKMFRTAK